MGRGGEGWGGGRKRKKGKEREREGEFWALFFSSSLLSSISKKCFLTVSGDDLLGSQVGERDSGAACFVFRVFFFYYEFVERVFFFFFSAQDTHKTKNSPLLISGPKRCSIDTQEYDDAETAARYPFRDVSSSGLATSGPLASE